MMHCKIFLNIWSILLVMNWKFAVGDDFISFYGNQLVTSTVDKESEIYKPMKFIVLTAKQDTNIFTVDYVSQNGVRMTRISAQIRNGLLEVMVFSSSGSVHNICENIRASGPRLQLTMILSKSGKFDVGINDDSCNDHSFTWFDKMASVTVEYRFGIYETVEKKLNFIGCISASRNGFDIFKISPENINVFTRLYNKPKDGCDPIFEADSFIFQNHRSTLEMYEVLSQYSTTVLKLNFILFKSSKGRLLLLSSQEGNLTGDLELNDGEHELCISKNTLKINDSDSEVEKHCMTINSEEFTLELTSKEKEITVKVDGKVSNTTLQTKMVDEDLRLVLGRSEGVGSVTGKIRKVVVFDAPLKIGQISGSLDNLLIDKSLGYTSCLEADMAPLHYESRNIIIEFKCWACNLSECRIYINNNPPVYRSMSYKFMIKAKFVNIQVGNDMYEFHEAFPYIDTSIIGHVKDTLFFETDLVHSYVNGILKLNNENGQSIFQVIEMITKVTPKNYEIVLPHGSNIGVTDLNLLLINKEIINLSNKDTIDEDVRENLICQAKYVEDHSILKGSENNETRLFSFGEILDQNVSYVPPISTPTKLHNFYFKDSKIEISCKYKHKEVKSFVLSIFPIKRNVTVVQNKIINAKYLSPVEITNKYVEISETDYIGNEINTKFMISAYPKHGELKARSGFLKIYNIFTKNDIKEGVITYTPTDNQNEDTFTIRVIDDVKPKTMDSPKRLEIKIKVHIEQVKLKTNDIYVRGKNYYILTAKDISIFSEIPNYIPRYSFYIYPTFGHVYYSSMNVTDQEFVEYFTSDDLTSGRMTYRTVCSHQSDRAIFTESMVVALKDDNDRILDKSVINIFIEIDSQPFVPDIPVVELRKKLYLSRNDYNTTLNFDPPISLRQNQLVSMGSNKGNYYVAFHITEIPVYDKIYTDHSGTNIWKMSKKEYLNYIKTNVEKSTTIFSLDSFQEHSVKYFSSVKSPPNGMIDSFYLVVQMSRYLGDILKGSYCFSGEVDIYIE